MEHGNQASKPTSMKQMTCFINHINQQNIKKPKHKVCLRKDHKMGKQTLEVALNCEHNQKNMELPIKQSKWTLPNGISINNKREQQILNGCTSAFSKQKINVSKS